MSSVVIGVDGGTTKTIALVADLEGRILGAARGSGSNWTGEDVEIPMAVVIQTVQEALAQAGVPSVDAQVGVFTLAGADWPEDHTRRQKVLERAGLARRIIVKNDSFAGLRAGARRSYGVVIAAGTGANTALITPSGVEWAYGYYQTYGGAVDLSREAIDAILRSDTGLSPSTLLTPLILKKLGFPDVENLLRALVANRIDKERKLSICPEVFEAAYQSDQVAADLLVRHGAGLAEYAVAAIRRYEMQKIEFDLVLAGSLFKGKGPVLVDTITREVHRVAPLAQVKRSRFEPVVGSVLLAYDALGCRTDDLVYERLQSTTPAADFFNTSSVLPEFDFGD